MLLTILQTILLVCLVLIVWIVIDFQLGKKAHKKKTDMFDPITRESEIQLFTSGLELYTDLFTGMRTAKQHIHVMFYIVKDDEISKEFFGILCDKAREGVEIRVLLDWVGSFPLRKNVVPMLKSQGIQFSYANAPKPPFLFYSSQTRNHRKITVIDGKTGYIGGFNIGKEYMNNDPKLSPWRDYHLKITNDGVRDLQAGFLKDWHKATKTNLLSNSIYFPELPKGPIRHQIMPTDGVYLEGSFSAFIRNAKSSVIIGTPYFIPSKRLMDDLCHALKRGVDIHILVPKKTDHLLVKEASFQHLRRLIKEGAYVYEYLHGFYHAKVMVVDESICDIGTANLDKRSLFLNEEINCYIFDEAFIKMVRDVLKKDISNSKRVTLKELNTLNPATLFKETIARSVASFL
ncbi:cardiolipin synthase [Bacillus mesophilum]|uniref:Cardiolipin synthase n=1 Tax=Bacillus mesophilum TaxID=1071718 RepID=A0A7V7RL86_9BACI|nr:cardiolipin synthase [Bacillus mesophilum]KAB2332476.1 cardiolipin synthase [Bacillus mesophilum]